MNEADLDQLVLDRVARPYAVEAVHLLEAQEADIAQIDAALEAVGYPLGPLRRLDEVGLDADVAVDEQLQAAYPRTARFDPPAMQSRLVAEGRTGRAVGRGFYTYADGADRQPDALHASPTAMPANEIVERLELAMINEAYRVVEEGLLPPPEIDRLIRTGSGFPRGPFEIVDELGLRRAVERLRAIHAATHERTADQYQVASALWQTATV